MNSGEIVEECVASELAQAKHPYTRGLLAAIPRLDENRDFLPVMNREGPAC
jgi:peptide/nickel transport system ATP-binding protein